MLKHPHFKGNTVITGIIPAACLVFLTIATASVYGSPGDFTGSVFILSMIFVLASVIVFLQAKNKRDLNSSGQ